MRPRHPRTNPRPISDRCRGQVAVAALFWAAGLALFALPFLRRQDAADWNAPDPGRKTEYVSEDDDVLDLPFLADAASLQEYADEEGWDLGADGLDATISAASRRIFGRDYRGYFAPDHETFEELFGEEGTPAPLGRAVTTAPIDLAAAEATGLFEVARLVPGEYEYLRQCAGCHGLAGDGAGPATRFLDPRPRNFRKGMFKFTTTPWGSRPRREDLMRTVTNGLVGASMPHFRLLSEQKRWDVVEYVRYLAVQGEFEQTMLTWTENDEELADPDDVAEFVADAWSDLAEQFPASTEPAADAASIERGRELYLSNRTSCAACHGDGGKGDGPTADAYRDAWGYPIRPRDMTTGRMRAGTEGKDLWVLIAHGIKGTPMPGQLGSLTPDEIWDLVHFVQHVASGGEGTGN